MVRACTDNIFCIMFMISAQSGAKMSHERGCFTSPPNFHIYYMCFENYLCNNCIHLLDIIHSACGVFFLFFFFFSVFKQ